MADETSEKSPARTPSYGSMLRMARIVLGLQARPFGWSLPAVCDALRISEKTVRRYVAAAASEVVDERGEPLVRLERQGGQTLLRLSAARLVADGTIYAVASLDFALQLLRFLDGTVLGDGVRALREALSARLSDKQLRRLANAERKFFAVPYAPKDYRGMDTEIDLLLRCLLDCQRVRIDYRGLLGEGRVHVFDPYTLAHYRGGLYLIGRSHLYGKLVYVAVERIRSVERVRGADGAFETFDYPDDYHPAKYTDGTFGLLDGEETDVALRLLSAETEAYVSCRIVHPTQRLERGADGRLVLRMRVRGTTELVHWILGYGPYLKVLRPESLRDEVARKVEETRRLYGK